VPGFVWDGKGNDGSQWPAGSYKLTATAKDSSGGDVAIATETQGVVDSVDLTATPALLSIGGKDLYDRPDQARDAPVELELRLARNRVVVRPSQDRQSLPAPVSPRRRGQARSRHVQRDSY